MLYIAIDTVEKLKAEFQKYDRDNFSDEGYAMILDEFECYGDYCELDVVALDCEYYEYFTIDDFLTEHGVPEDDLEEGEDEVEAAIEAMENWGGYAWQLSNGHVLVREC